MCFVLLHSVVSCSFFVATESLRLNIIFAIAFAHQYSTLVLQRTIYRYHLCAMHMKPDNIVPPIHGIGEDPA